MGHRILFLSDDPRAVRSQLDGADLALEQAQPLREQISTDEITPAWVCFYYDERLGDYVYLGVRSGGEFPIRRGDVRAGGFVASVSGARRGKGSSREASVVAELAAGIRLAIAPSFERIYEQNCLNLGLLTTTDFGWIDRLRAGERPDPREFATGRDPLAAEVIRAGGLFGLTRRRGSLR
ncbi:MAG TPA: 3-isopropylmalate dehydratase, partial [Burkholderiaceae bacterium]|nr:3-isopropylmalate dehydratase [Burkholderiaceae bacterium]